MPTKTTKGRSGPKSVTKNTASAPERFQLSVEQLRWSIDPAAFPFTCTDDLQPLDGFIGQDRAIKAIHFALEVEKPGYNLFVTGLTGTGKASAIKAHIDDLIDDHLSKNVHFEVFDWCYVYNFTDPDQPQVAKLPQGMGRKFRSKVEDLLKKIRDELPKIFSDEEYKAQRKKVEEEGRGQHKRVLEEIQREARQIGFGIQFSPMGVNIFPFKDNRPLAPEEFAALPEATRNEIERLRASLAEKVQGTLESLRTIESETVNKLREMERKAAEAGLMYIFRDLSSSFPELPEVQAYINALKEYTFNNLAQFQPQEPDERPAVPTPPVIPGVIPIPGTPRNPFLPYEVNLFVDNSQVKNIPIIIESNPTWGNLFGRIERRAVMGTYLSDHTMLKAGGVHRANGGYLILNVRELLLNAGVWEGLKRIIRNREARLEDPYEQFGMLAPQGLRPQPIPLNIKVIVTSEETTYRQLHIYDQEDLWELFKVKAEFDFQIDRNDENIQGFCNFICATCKVEKLLPFDQSAAAQVIEHAARIVSDQYKLSSRFGVMKDLLIESDYWARQANASMVSGMHVKKALDERFYRHNLIEERLRHLLAEGVIMVDTEGEVVGQVNGLVFYDLGDISFGRPARITARTFTGASGVVNIEREAQLSGPIHNKGVLILSGYLGWKYAQDKPLSLSASLSFEQSYSGVEGDSASSAELYAILSSLSELPLKQYITVTGSVNQKGEIQPIGGVNQKIEGFFDLCRLKGLTGNQGVVIPHQNVKNLMLRQDVVEAAGKGQFHIYSVKTIDEGIEILTGVPAGERQPDGSYPDGTINYLVNQKLQQLGQSMKGYYSGLFNTDGHSS
jgi:predicted ATP-dependent protease